MAEKKTKREKPYGIKATFKQAMQKIVIAPPQKKPSKGKLTN